MRAVLLGVTGSWVSPVLLGGQERGLSAGDILGKLGGLCSSATGGPSEKSGIPSLWLPGVYLVAAPVERTPTNAWRPGLPADDPRSGIAWAVGGLVLGLWLSGLGFGLMLTLGVGFVELLALGELSIEEPTRKPFNSSSSSSELESASFINSYIISSFLAFLFLVFFLPPFASSSKLVLYSNFHSGAVQYSMSLSKGTRRGTLAPTQGLMMGFWS